MISRTRAFVFGALGTLAVLVAAAIVVPQYSDYRARARAYEMFILSESLQGAVEARIRASHVVENSGVGVDATELKKRFDVLVLRDGELVLRSRTFGQVLVLVPAFVDEKVSWTCLGGSSKDVPTQCRAQRRADDPFRTFDEWDSDADRRAYAGF